MRKTVVHTGRSLDGPIGTDHPLCHMDHAVLTPHSASYADLTMDTGRRRAGRAAPTTTHSALPEFVADPEVVDGRRR
jgi:phosphoglycerate dehydrogenase-like enzyme